MFDYFEELSVIDSNGIVENLINKQRSELSLPTSQAAENSAARRMVYAEKFSINLLKV